MGIELIYPTINLFQYNLREGLGDSDAAKLARSRSFYSKFLPDLAAEDTGKDLELYRSREQPDREFKELLYVDEKSPVYLPLAPSLDGYYFPVQLGDTYALHLNFSGKAFANDRDKRRPQDLDTAVTNLTDYLSKGKILPGLDRYSFGQTWLVVSFVDNPQANKLEIAKSCDRQITGDLSDKSIRNIGRGEWMGGEIFEFWTPPLTVRDELNIILNKSPHTLVCLFPADKFDDINSLLPNAYKDWIRLCHYRHKIFYAYYQSQFIKNNLKLANTKVRDIGSRLGSRNPSLPHLQHLLFDTLQEFQSYGENVQALEDQQYTIEIDRDNYRLRHELIEQSYPSSTLGFLLEFDTKYSNKYNRQIRADRAHLDSGLKVLESLSQAIQGTIQIEQTKSDRTTNLTIAAFGIGLAVSQVVSAIVLTQTPPNKNTPFYQTSAFQVSLISGSIPILFLLMYLVWFKVRSYKSK
jgi:hypothetical protein